MKNVNQLVLDVQAEGNESYAYVELFEILNRETIIPKAESFKKQLKGHVDEAISRGYELMMELVQSWKGTGNFHSLFKTSYTNRLINLTKELTRDIRVHDNNYAMSLSESAIAPSGESSPVLEVTTHKELQNHIDFDATGENKVETLLAEFAEVEPEKADLVNIMLGFHDDKKKADEVEAYCVYYGIPKEKYNEIAQKKVSRAKEAFYKFLQKKNYELSF